MLRDLQDILMARGLVDKRWAHRTEREAERTKLYRRYYHGEHRLKLTDEMRKMMQIDDDVLDRYNANYADLVVHTMADRVQLDAIEATGGDDDVTGALMEYLAEALPAGADVQGVSQTLITRFQATSSDETQAQAWVDTLQQDNGMDALQMAVTVAMLRDGITYVMSAYEDDSIRWHHELAFDGAEGIIPVWDNRREHLVAAAKIYYQGDEQYVTLYMPDSIERYKYGTYGEGKETVTEMRQRAEPESNLRNGQPAGIPLVPFENKVGDSKKTQSELRDVIPLQDSLNRSMVSMVIDTELAGFGMLLAIGVAVDNGFTPGEIIQVLARDENGKQIVPDSPEMAKSLADYYDAMRVERIEGSDAAGFIAVCDWFINQISVVSSTPIPVTLGGDSQSGEALKQREVGLLGKVRRVHVHLSAGYKALLELSYQQEQVLAGLVVGQSLPAIEKFDIRWKDAQVRNDADIQASADWYIRNGFVREGLRVMSQSSLASHTERDIDRLLAERAQDMRQDNLAAGAGVPGMEQFAAGTELETFAGQLPALVVGAENGGG